MALGDTLRRIVASDNFILNAAGALVGIKNPNANGLDLRVDQPAAYLPSILAQTGVAFIIPSSGSSNASGQITLTTALPAQPAGTVQVYLPAGVVVGDATGGMYPATFSSTTVCQLVGSLVTANASYTQSTSEVTLTSITVPGNALGINGVLRISDLWTCPNNANNKSIRRRLAGFSIYQLTATTSASANLCTSTRNRGSQATQVTNGSSSTLFGTTGAAAIVSSADTSVNQTLSFQAQLTAATDYLVLEGLTVEVLPAA